MSDDGLQGMLFGSTSSRRATPDGISTDTVGIVRICALNVQSANAARAQRIVDWLLGTTCDVLVLTELQGGAGGRHLVSCLEAEGFDVTCGPGWSEERFFAAVACRGRRTGQDFRKPFSSRIAAVDITSNDSMIRVVGIYAPTNGMTAESSAERRRFQADALEYLDAVAVPSMCVGGDLNVLEPGHQPNLPAFLDHDYDFYRGFGQLGLQDVYRLANPSGRDHSWISERFGSQRLDHIFASSAAGSVERCFYDHTTRAAKLSDHAALIAEIRSP